MGGRSPGASAKRRSLLPAHAVHGGWACSPTDSIGQFCARRSGGLARRETIPFGDGEIAFLPLGDAAASIPWDAEIEWPGPNLPSSRLVVGRRAIIKLYRRVIEDTSGARNDAPVDGTRLRPAFPG